MLERLAFVQACLNRTRTIVEICREFGVSEKTGQKILKRFKEEGVEGLVDRSHAVHHHPFAISDEVEARILELKKAHPDYGAPMIHDWLIQHEPSRHWPAASSINELLKRHRLIYRRRRRRRDEEGSGLNTELTSGTKPNIVWTADFKGQFRLKGGLGSYCYPLTVMDLSSRFVLGIKALKTTGVKDTKNEFVRLFSEYGLPEVIRTDNGVPFAQPNALGRLGQLAFWWVRLGIKPEHIRPARPSENGAHERFHRTMKAATTRPSSAQSLQAQQVRFEEFRDDYNTHRPHSALKNKRPPAEFYAHSKRRYPAKLPVLSYSGDSSMRRVSSSGTIKWRSTHIFLSANIGGEYVAITEEENNFSVRYGKLKLGLISPRTNDFTAGLSWLDDD